MVKVEGLGETVKALREMGKLEDKVLKSIVKVQSDKILSDARQSCVSETVRRNINYITKNDAKFPRTVLIGITGGNTDGTETMTAPALASLLEYGSAPRYTKDGKFRGQIVAKPFIRTAFDRNKGAAMEGIKNGLVKYVRRIAEKNNLK